MSPAPDEPEDAFRAVPRTRPRNRDRGDRAEGIDEVVAKSNAIAAKPVRHAIVPRTEKNSTPQSADQLNMVLDKISKHGIESLTSEELRVLEDMSRKLRGTES